MSTDPAWPAGYGRVILDEADSTMAEAARRAPQLAGPTWILAHRQTAAHGRRGRPWQDLGGNFAATLHLMLDAPMKDVALRSFSSALALRDALAAFIPPERLSLKWPNDVLLDGGKVAGILLEAGQLQGQTRLAIGIGVNLVSAPNPAQLEAGAAAPVSLAGQGGAAPSPEVFLTHLARAFAQHEQQFAAYGFAPIRTLWLQNAARLGQMIRARTVTEEHHGTFETVDMDGALVITTAEGPRAIPAADVYF